MDFTIDFKILRNSIVNKVDSEDLKEDKTEPFSFVVFVKKIGVSNVSNDFIVDTYNKYLIEWSKIKKISGITFIEQRRAKYIQLLKTIQLKYVTQDEERILSNLDYNNPLELEVAIPFFVEKIKDIIEYYTNKRTQVKSSKSKWSSKGSFGFLKNTVAEYIINNYTRGENTFQKYKKDFQELSSFQTNYQIKYDGLYDTKSYAHKEITIDNEDFLKNKDDYILSSLPITAFSDYNRDSSTLISELKKDLFKKYVTLDTTYYSSTTSVDIESVTPFYDNNNYIHPLISRISNTEGMLEQRDIGYYYTSRFIMASKYISPNGISLKDTKDFVGLLPKIDTYYQNDYVDYYFWSKYDPTYLGMSNKPVKNKRLKRFHGYESRNIRINDSSGGVNQYTDKIQLWDGVRNELWANDDIFDKYSKNILNRKEKENYFFVLNPHESVYKYSVDIFGNEYYLIKEIDKQEPNQNDIYSIPLFVSESNESSILIGQRATENNDLLGIKTADDCDCALGFFDVDKEDFLEELKDFHINSIGYYPLSSTEFNTQVLSSDRISSGKSIYEYGFSTGHLVVRSVDGKLIKRYPEFIDNTVIDAPNLYTQLSSDIIDFDIAGDLTIITTSDYTFTSKIIFNFKTSDLSYTELNKNIILNFNLPLHKSAKYWNSSSNNSVYFVNISVSDEYIIPNIKKLYINNNVINDIDLSNIPISSYKYNYPIEVKCISKPNVIKNNTSIYIITLLHDICGNYFFNLIEFKEITSSKIELVKNTIYKQDYQLLTEDLISSNSLTSLQSSIDFDLYLNYYSTSDGLIEKPIPESTPSSYSYYDNDESSIITKSKPSLIYNLNDIVTTVNTSSITVDEESYTYNTKTIYTPSTISLDIANLSSLNETGLSSIPENEHIIKIEYEIDDRIFVRNVSNNENLISPLFDTAFTSSPLNQVPFVYNNTSKSGVNLIIIRMYSTSNKIYKFEFLLNQWSVDISNQFTKLELLDSRINNTDSGTNLVLYLNSRIPDYIIPLKLINI